MGEQALPRQARVVAGHMALGHWLPQMQSPWAMGGWEG